MSDTVRWLAEHHLDGVLHGRVGRAGDELVAEWIAVATLRARRDGSDVRFVPTDGADPDTVEKIRQGSARVLLRHLGGELGLHGSAVALEGRCIGLFGCADAGKSTLAASLCVRRGAALLADDAIALDRTPEGFAVVPLETDHWLDRRSRKALGLEGAGEDKRPVRSGGSAAARVPLSALVHVTFAEGESPRLVPLAGVEAVAALLPQVVRFVVDDPELQRTELSAIAALVARVPMFRLERPRRLELLDATTAIVAELAKVK